MPFLIKRKQIFLLLLIFVFPFVIYANSFQNNFLAGDDQNIILNNSYLKDWKYFGKFFTENYIAGSGLISNYWRPFQLIVYSLIVHIFGFNPVVFHLSSILLHSLCGVLIFIIFLKLFRGKSSFGMIAALVLVWLAHPIHNEELSVTTGIASPAYLFWILMGLLTFLIFQEQNKRRWYIISLISFVFALSSKEGSIVFPGLLLGMHITCVKAGLSSKIRLKGYIYRHLAFWLIALFYGISRLSFLKFGNTLNFYNESNVFTQHLAYRFYTLLTVLASGLRIIFMPMGLHPERSWPVFTGFISPEVISSFLILTATVILAFISWKKNPLFSFGLFWFFFSYIPMSNIVSQINSLMCDHWFYLPSVGVLLSVTALSVEMTGVYYRRSAVILLVLAALIFGGITYLRNPHWKDTEAISRYILTYEPGSARVWNNLAMSLSDRGEKDKAVKCFLKAISIYDVYPQTHHNLANIYFDSGEYGLAEKEFLRAIELDSKFFYSYLGLGKLYLSEGDRGKAAYCFKLARQIYPYLSQETLNFIESIDK